jgi:Spy/CpxP family protein refolding chaperone
MKKVLAGIVLTAFVAVGVYAQDQNPGFTDKQHRGRHRFDMTQQLNLTDEQKTGLKGINEDYRQQMSELKKNEDITVREWKSKMATIRKEHHEKIEKLLTPEQKASLKKMRQHHRGDMKKHGEQRLEKMKKELNLTDDQVAALKKNHEDMAQKFKAIHDDKSLTDEQKKAQFKEYKKQQHDNLKSILTPEQLQKLEQHHKKHPADPKGSNNTN